MFKLDNKYTNDDKDRMLKKYFYYFKWVRIKKWDKRGQFKIKWSKSKISCILKRNLGIVRSHKC